MKTNIIKTTNALVEKLPNNIIRIEYIKNHIVTLQDTKEVEKAFLQLATQEDLYGLLTTLDAPAEISDEALEFFAHKAESIPRMKGFAMVLHTLPERIMARVFTKFHRPKFPTKVFKTNELAINWLKSLQK